MNYRSVLILSAFAAFLAFAGCNSATYEIIEVEEEVEIKEEMKTVDSDIKTENFTSETPVENKEPETRYTEKQVISRTYVIQIGAYISEYSAEKLVRRASTKIADPNISYKFVDGLYKVRLSREFQDKNEAIEYLKTIWALRFGDSFVVEVTRVRTE
jgi:SPOR domain